MKVLELWRYTAVPHERFGNERAWSVTGGDLALGQIVHLHAMCGKTAAIFKAIKQDEAEKIRNRIIIAREGRRSPKV